MKLIYQLILPLFFIATHLNGAFLELPSNQEVRCIAEKQLCVTTLGFQAVIIACHAEWELLYEEMDDQKVITCTLLNFNQALNKSYLLGKIEKLINRPIQFIFNRNGMYLKENTPKELCWPAEIFMKYYYMQFIPFLFSMENIAEGQELQFHMHNSYQPGIIIQKYPFNALGEFSMNFLVQTLNENEIVIEMKIDVFDNIAMSQKSEGLITIDPKNALSFQINISENSYSPIAPIVWNQETTNLFAE